MYECEHDTLKITPQSASVYLMYTAAASTLGSNLHFHCFI